jgi:hypothetical protein
MIRNMYLYRIRYDTNLTLDFDAYSAFHAVQQFQNLSMALKWGTVPIQEVSRVERLYYEIRTP